MHQSKLIELLKTFQAGQIRRLGEMAESPFFNKHDELKTFAAQVLRHGPEFTSPQLERGKLYHKCFPGKELDEKKLSYLMTGLLKLAEELLVQERLQHRQAHKEVYLLEAYNELNLAKHYRKALADMTHHDEKTPYLDAHYFYREFRKESVNNMYFDRQRKHAYDDSLQKAADNLDLYYLNLKLKHSCEIFNRKNVIAAEYEQRLLDEILLYVDKHDFSHAPGIAIYYRILMTLTDGDNEEHFARLKKLLNTHAGSFPHREARDMYTYAQNYCIKRVNMGHEQYLEELFNIYKDTLNKGVIFDEGILSPWSYKNIVGVALRVAEYDWAYRFIHDYKTRLKDNQQENAYLFNLASYYFNKKEYNQALDRLRSVEFTDVFYNLDSKCMMLRIYYETEEVDALQSLLDSFRTYLNRNKLLSEYQRSIYLNLVRFTRDMVRLPPGDPVRLQKLEQRLQNTKQIAYRQWLLDKVGLLKR